MAPGWEEFVSIPSLLARRVRAGFVLSSERERMERPNHLKTAQSSNSSKLTGFIIVVAIHIAAIAALVTALASRPDHEADPGHQGFGRTRKDSAQGAAAAAAGFGQAAAAGRHRSGIPACSRPSRRRLSPPSPSRRRRRPRAPPSRQAPTELKAIARTHPLPPYPPISQRLGEQGTSQLQVAISTEGNVTDCKIAKSSGSERLDTAACDYVKDHWRWQPPTREGKPVAANTMVDVVWNLKNAQ